MSLRLFLRQSQVTFLFCKTPLVFSCWLTLVINRARKLFLETISILPLCNMGPWWFKMKAPRRSNFFGKKNGNSFIVEKKLREQDKSCWRPRNVENTDGQYLSSSPITSSPQRRRIICSFLISLLAKEGSDTTQIGRRLQRDKNYYYETDFKYSFMSRTQRQSLPISVSALRKDTTN